MLSKIKELAASKNLPLMQLEKNCGLTNGSIYHWDKIKPSYDKVVKVARELGVTVEELAESNETQTGGDN